MTDSIYIENIGRYPCARCHKIPSHIRRIQHKGAIGACSYLCEECFQKAEADTDPIRRVDGQWVVSSDRKPQKKNGAT